MASERPEILLSNYGEGALGVLTFGWGELVCTIFTAIVFYVGIKTRLRSEEVIANVENIKETAAEHIDGE